VKRDIEDVLDECLALLQGGQSTLGECLARYPDRAAELRPLLETALDLDLVSLPACSPAAFEAGKRRMLQALAEKGRCQIFSSDPSSRVKDWMSLGRRKGTPRRRSLVSEREVRRRVGRPRTVRLLPLALVAFLLLASVTATGLLLQSWLGGRVAQTATLTGVSGAVQVLSSGSDAWCLAAEGELVASGDRVRTGASSAVTLSFFEGGVSTLDANTDLIISQLRSNREGGTQIIVLYQRVGRTFNRVQPLSGSASRFEIETPAAVASVRGTEFTVVVEPEGATGLGVTEGRVDVTAQGATVVVRAGHGTSVRLGQSPGPAYRLPPGTADPAVTATATCTPTPTLVPTPSRTQRLDRVETPSVPPRAETAQPPGRVATLQPLGQIGTPQQPGQTEMPESSDQLSTLPPPLQIETPRSFGQTSTPQSPGQTAVPQSSDHTMTPQPPGHTNTPQPPGQTQTPEPPGQTSTPEPPGQTDTPCPPGQTNTPRPPGQTNTPQPPGQTKTPQPPGQTRTPQPPGRTKTPRPTKAP
jgi:hypothetical protein